MKMKDSYSREIVSDTIFRSPNFRDPNDLLGRIKPYLPFWGVSLAWAVAYWPAIKTLLAEWIVVGAGNYGHGFLVLSICIYFIWHRRQALLFRGKSANAAGVIAVAVLGFGWLVGFSTNTLIVQQFAVVVLFHALVLSVFGFSAYKALFFPLLLIFSAVPIWGELQDPLRELSTGASFRMLQAMGTPILMQGYRLTVPGGVFVVERACSGLNFLLVSLVLSWMFCYIHRLRGVNRGLLILLSALVAILANWVRIVLIILLGDATNMQHFLVKDHLYAGWVVYAITLLPLFWLGYRLSMHGATPANEANADGGATTTTDSVADNNTNNAVGSVAKTNVEGESFGAGKFLHPLAVALLAVLFPIVPLLSHYWVDIENEINNLHLGALEGAQLIKKDINTVVWAPHFTGADFEQNASYRFEGYKIYAYVASYQRQKQGKELIHYSNGLYDKNKWWYIEDKRVTLASSSDLRLLRLGSNKGKRLIGYWYLVSDSVAASDLEAKLFEVRGVFTGQKNAAVIAVALDYESLPDEQAAGLMVRFCTRLRRTFSQQ